MPLMHTRLMLMLARFYVDAMMLVIHDSSRCWQASAVFMRKLHAHNSVFTLFCSKLNVQSCQPESAVFMSCTKRSTCIKQAEFNVR